MPADETTDSYSPIRRYRPADEDAYIEMWLRSTILGQSFLPEQHWRTMEPDIRALLRQFETWVIDGHFGMVAALSLVENLIGGLFVHPDHQGSGLGSQLVTHAQSLRRPLFVEVFAANELAIDFYLRCGFHDHETHADPDTGLELLTMKMPQTDPST